MGERKLDSIKIQKINETPKSETIADLVDIITIEKSAHLEDIIEDVSRLGKQAKWENISLKIFLTSIFGFIFGAALAIFLLNGSLDFTKRDINRFFQSIQK